jgi:hypothetical protein|tara:strand:+ start:847 stop:1125 length:279 start_codon:yes stop_codon:yes gene_type:complete
MKLKEMVELVQQHHPQMGGQEIVKMINRAQDEYSSRTRLSEDSHTYTVVDGQRRYSLNVSGNKDAIMEIKNVDLNGKTIKRFTGRPITRDLS